MSTEGNDNLLNSFSLPDDEEFNYKPPEKPKTPEEIQAEKDAELVKLRQSLGEQTARADALAMAVNRPIAPGANQPEPTTPDYNEQAKQMAAQFGQKFLTDPGGAAMDLLKVADLIADQKIKAATGPLAQSVGAGNARAYKARLQQTEGAQFPIIEQELDVMLNPDTIRSLSAMTPENQDIALEAITNMAYGSVARKQARNGRREIPPPYDTGTNLGGGRRTETQRKQLSEVQKQYIISARAANIPEDRIAERVQEFEAEGY